MAQGKEILFHTDSLFSGQVGVIDHDAGVIHGVSLIKGNLMAEGHELFVDPTTLQQLHECAKQRGKIPVNLDHGSGISATCGFVTDFRIDGDKLRGDLHLLTNHNETRPLLERAEKMPDCFGLSVAFKGPPKGVAIGGGRMAARCEKLLSVDLVTRPAANEGLFSAKQVDTTPKVMPDPIAQAQPAPEPTLADVLNAVKDLGARVEKQEATLSQLTQPQGEVNPEDLTLEDLTQMTDEALQQLGLTREDVDNAIAEIEQAEASEQQGVEDDPNAVAQPGQAQAAQVAAGESQGATVGAATGGGELAALKREVVELKRKQTQVEFREKKQAEDIELSAIEEKAMTLAKQRDTAIELAEKLQAENDALRLAVKTGTRPVKAGVDTGLRMFSANGEGQLHEFQQRVKQLKESGKSEAQAITMAQKENPGSHASWLQSMRTKQVVPDQD